jgi:hypothetical protein
MGRRKLIEPVFRLKEDARGNFEVTWTDPSTGATRRKSCGTQLRKEAELRMPGIVAGIRSPLEGVSNYVESAARIFFLVRA